ncbi:Uncharacterized protein TCM_010800 isoform 1 [Theobroma cacao]|uniref:Uncharacterized protein isoform 1 n=1 Tax=Theobroma cacao TaxID=3641 RepID=A0A061E7D2_THECC|nr:Uncharacterized protein TCM_010800 isoform 1 [Theobroma cacao]EOY00882.1 Uncharacterized protein TCM_010800 isoform 1 [Theobroma cacao]
MGNCVTVYKNKDPAAMNLSAQIQSPSKENFVRREHSVAELGSRPQPSSLEPETSFRNLSKTENFFDSQPWLESDCEDFFSVNGDSTSSCGNSPNHQKSFTESSLPDKNHSTDCAQDAVSQHSPTETKKQLIELFRESFDDGDAVNDDPSLDGRLKEKPATFSLRPKSTSRSPSESIPNSVQSSEATPYRAYLPKKEKSAQSAQCCLPSLVRNMSFGERKKRLSPAKTDGW